jgi:hypothetical protein
MKKNRTVKELNFDFDELLKRVKQLEETSVIEKPNSENDDIGFKAILESYDQKIENLAPNQPSLVAKDAPNFFKRKMI